ncbi:MAG: amidohydrolase family protein [Pseudomonadota bacterium]
MRFRRAYALVFLAVATLQGCVSFTPYQPAPTEADLVIRNATIVGAGTESVRENVDIAVMDSRIVAITEHPSPYIGIQTIDATGRYVIPGLIDAHTHPFPIERSFSQFMHYGVMTILVTGCSLCTNERMAALRALGKDNMEVAPRVFHTSQHVTMEGRHPVKTYPTPNWVEGSTVFYLRDREDIAPLIARLADDPIVGIKLTIEKGPIPPFVEPISEAFVTEVVSQAHARNVKVYAHVSDIAGAEVANRAGVDHLLHFTGVTLDWDQHAAMIEGFVDRDLHWVTTLMIDKSFLYPLNPDWIMRARDTSLFDEELDRFAATGMSIEGARRAAQMIYGEPDPVFAKNPLLQQQFDNLLWLHKSGIKLVTGTDVGNRYILPGFSLHEEMELLELGGFKPLEILKMATINAAELIDADDSLGSVEIGKIADLVVLARDPRSSIAHLRDIDMVIKGGNPLPIH